MLARARAPLAAAALATFALLLVSTSPALADDFARDAYNVLPPGQSGSLFPLQHSLDQLPLYDGLTPNFDRVNDADLPDFYKPNIFGLPAGETPSRVEQPPQRPDLLIERDSFDVPHISAPTRADIMFGVGWVHMEDRALLMETFRGPGRIAALDAPGLNAFALAAANRKFQPTPETEAFLANQLTLLQAQGPEGQQVVDDFNNYVQGINAAAGTFGSFGGPWTTNDALAAASLLAGVFGKGGGDETRRAMFLDGLQDRLGTAQGNQVWEDLRELNDPETSHTIDRPFRWQHRSLTRNGNAVIDAGSFDGSGVNQVPANMSNALLIDARRSITHRPLFVAGPQVGYAYPALLTEVDLHGGGIDARGVSFPGSAPYVQLGRGQDFAWSATSAGSDVVDQYVETLCGDDTHYMYNGECREMTVFNAGNLTNPTQPVRFRETVHGPVIGYATVDGERVAISSKRSTRGREALSAFGFKDFNENDVTSPRTFFNAANRIELTFNWSYVDSRDIAIFSSGRLPQRSVDVDVGLPAKGTGEYEWEGFASQARHPQVINPPDGDILNWNNKPAPQFGAADDNWAYGSVHRNRLLEHAVNRRHRHTLGSLVAAMNRAATQDLRTAEVLPSIVDVLEDVPAPDARAQQMVDLLQAWHDAGSSRLDVDLDGKIDDPGAAIMDSAWPKIADAVMSPVLGPQLNELASLMGRDNRPSSGGSAYGSGWYGYVDKDLRAVDSGAQRYGHWGGWHGHWGRNQDMFATRFCGSGDKTECGNSLWAALDAAATELETAQGSPNPADWRSDATAERIRFPGSPFWTGQTMRWTNRPTFQQAMSFRGHR
jgi:acyl-homoserine lactone acylase PvdQ